MSNALALSPLGTARSPFGDPGEAASLPESETELIEWLQKIGVQLESRYNLDQATVFLAWELARWPPGLAIDERRSLIIVILTVLVHERQGSTRIGLRDHAGRARCIQIAAGFLGDGETAARQSLDQFDALVDSGRLSAIVGSADDFKPLIISGLYLYLQKMLRLEDGFVARLIRRFQAHVPARSPIEIDRACRDMIDRPVHHDGRYVTLAAEQEAAVRAAVSNAVTLITGGPGTGKTTVVLSILRVLGRLGIACAEIALAAPTGKAANRLGEAIQGGVRGIANQAPADRELLDHGVDPKTLHRLLGYSSSSGRFQYHENNRLAERVVIIDEGSMIDLAMMERLVRSLRDDAILIVLGDAHQLPSVEAGAVLRDMVAAGDPEAGARTLTGFQVVRLVESYRMRRDDPDGRNIYTVAQAIDAGRIVPFTAIRDSDQAVVERDSVSKVEFHGVEFLAAAAGADVVDKYLAHWFRQKLAFPPDLRELATRRFTLANDGFDDEDEKALRKLFVHSESHRVLCVTRVSPTTGADRINHVLHALVLNEHNSEARTRNPLGFGNQADDELIPGEPVMMQVNDYQRMLYNGDQGLVLNVADAHRARRMVVFPRSTGFAAFSLDSLRPMLRLSYAMTVHKSQGSEFDGISLFLPDQDVPINTREILYTALTRGRKSVVILGARDIWKDGLGRTLHRDSGIIEKLHAPAIIRS